jgi:diguanylate cyclase (GGDEF)-like protein
MSKEKRHEAEIEHNLATGPGMGLFMLGVVEKMAQSYGHELEKARYDELTGLLRPSELKPEIKKAMGSGTPFVLFLMDLNRFKEVNDELGHQKGNEVLEDLGKVLRKKFRRKGDAVVHGESEGSQSEGVGIPVRFGGDEFAIIADLSKPNLPENERRDNADITERAKKTERSLQDTLDNFVAEQDSRIRDLGFGASFGSALWRPGDKRNPDELIELADKKMYEAKENYQWHF